MAAVRSAAVMHRPGNAVTQICLSILSSPSLNLIANGICGYIPTYSVEVPLEALPAATVSWSSFLPLRALGLQYSSPWGPAY